MKEIGLFYCPYIPESFKKRNAMCSLSNEECKELVLLLKGYQEYIIKQALDVKVNMWLEKLEPYALRCDEPDSEGSSTHEEYDPQF